MVYFAKSVPATPIYLSTGQKVNFPTVDGITGYYRTENEFLIAEFKSCIAGHRGGLRVIDAREYAEFEKKTQNSTPLRQPWREEFKGRAVAPDTITRGVDAAVAADPAPKPQVVELFEEPKAQAARPRVGRRHQAQVEV